ncbi:MAG: hypothetical protein LLG00_04740, partial [Planctomycetaceae bacterium]|nr:hypothetical protein [Planctomycetaceae bacterium]
MMRIKAAIGPLLCLFAVDLPCGFALRGLPPALNPKTYTSPSGVYSLYVDPTEMYGQGKGNCRLMKNGKTIWARTLPYTFCEAILTDNGQVAGYAYTNGREGFSRENDSHGHFIIAVLGADGKALTEEKHWREASSYPDGSPTPLVAGIVTDRSNQRFVVRIMAPDVNRGDEEWWVHSLTDGKRLVVLNPHPTTRGQWSDNERLFDARSVPSTPLVLTHWSKFDKEHGAVFTLVDLNDSDAKPVWTLALDGDYSVPGNDKAEDAIWEHVREHGVIFEAKEPSRFAIHAVKPRQRIDYSVQKRAGGGWLVKEVRRTPYEFPRPDAAQKTPAFPEIELKEVAAVRLRGGQQRNESVIRDIWEFDFDKNGNLGALSARRNEEPHLLYLTQRGEVLKDLRVPLGKPLPSGKYSGPVGIGDGKFVLTISGYGEHDKTRCFVADFDAGTVKELTHFRSPNITALAGFPDGRFAALTVSSAGYTWSHGLNLFDAEGKLVWDKVEWGSNKPGDLLSPEDLCRYGDDSIAVLDVIRHTVQLFDASGKFVRRIDLEKAWKREPNHPSHIAADRQGNFAICDFNAQFPLVQTDSNGQIQHQCTVKFANGRPFSARRL